MIWCIVEAIIMYLIIVKWVLLYIKEYKKEKFDDKIYKVEARL